MTPCKRSLCPRIVHSFIVHSLVVRGFAAHLGTVLVLICTAGALSPAPGRAQTPASGAGLESLSLFAPGKLSVEINLEGSLLDMVAGSVEEKDPDFARLLSGLRSIQVRVTEAGEEIDEAARQELQTAGGRLRDSGWKPIVRVQEDDEEISIFLREDGERIGGLVVMFLEIGEEAGLVQIDGDLDPALLGTLIHSFDSGSFEALTEALGNLSPQAEASAEKEPEP
jgi:hypothetical protein